MVVVEHRPTERPRRRKSEGKKTRCIYVFEAFIKKRTRKKKSKGEEEEEEEEGCTYTNAIERVSAQVEKKKRQESFLVRAACCYVAVDENEVHPYYRHHLFFNKYVGFVCKKKLNKKEERKNEEEGLLQSIFARFLSHVYSVFFSLSFCVVSGKTAQVVARLWQILHRLSTHTYINLLIYIFLFVCIISLINRRKLWKDNNEFF